MNDTFLELRKSEVLDIARDLVYAFHENAPDDEIENLINDLCVTSTHYTFYRDMENCNDPEQD